MTPNRNHIPRLMYYCIVCIGSWTQHYMWELFLFHLMWTKSPDVHFPKPILSNPNPPRSEDYRSALTAPRATLSD